MIDRWSRSDLVGRRIYHLLELDLGGRTYRYATAPLDIDDDAKGIRATHYAAGLDAPRFAEELQRREPSVSVRIVDPSTDWAAVIFGQGHDITTATAATGRWPGRRAGLRSAWRTARIRHCARRHRRYRAGV